MDFMSSTAVNIRNKLCTLFEEFGVSENDSEPIGILYGGMENTEQILKKMNEGVYKLLQIKEEASYGLAL
ncbi:hypothetical protein CVS40_10681 [Lucilia cuprina]|nr:hypothetical protein CVS40_10681 [Lucilia cuprina]